MVWLPDNFYMIITLNKVGLSLMAETEINKTVDSELNSSKRNVWIFQGNPKKYEVYNSLLDESLKEDTWLVSRYRDDIRIGDIALIWKAGQRSGIYAVGEILTNPQEMYDPPESRKYWKSEVDKNKKAVRVLIQYKLKLRLTNALFSKELRLISELRNMEIFKQHKEQILELVHLNGI
jgi:hypothetical protein